MAFIPAALAAVGSAFGATAGTAALAGATVLGAGASIGSTIAGAVSGGGKATTPPPPPGAPPPPATSAAPSIAEQGAAERDSLAGAAGAGFSGTDVTGGQGASNPNTTQQKSLLG